VVVFNVLVVHIQLQLGSVAAFLQLIQSFVHTHTQLVTAAHMLSVL